MNKLIQRRRGVEPHVRLLAAAIMFATILINQWFFPRLVQCDSSDRLDTDIRHCWRRYHVSEPVAPIFNLALIFPNWAPGCHTPQ